MPGRSIEGGVPPPLPSRLPLLYFAFAHLCLAASLATLGTFPGSFTGFFYHPRMLAAVHLVTLGWITSHIAGALYMIAPMALQTRLVTNRADTVAFWAYAVGVTGMVAHFWIGESSGMVWGAPRLAWLVHEATSLAQSRLPSGAVISSCASLVPMAHITSSHFESVLLRACACDQPLKPRLAAKRDQKTVVVREETVIRESPRNGLVQPIECFAGFSHVSEV